VPPENQTGIYEPYQIGRGPQILCGLLPIQIIVPLNFFWAMEMGGRRELAYSIL